MVISASLARNMIHRYSVKLTSPLCPDGRELMTFHTYSEGINELQWFEYDYNSQDLSGKFELIRIDSGIVVRTIKTRGYR